MASGWYTEGLKRLLTDLNVSVTSLKGMLVDSTYAFDKTETTLTALAAKEISCTGYTGGYGGAGRKAATVTAQANQVDGRVDVAVGDLTGSTLGTGATVGGTALIYETGGNDASSIPIAWLDLADTPTNGGDITLDFAALGAGGNLRVTA